MHLESWNPVSVRLLRQASRPTAVKVCSSSSRACLQQRATGHLWSSAPHLRKVKSGEHAEKPCRHACHNGRWFGRCRPDISAFCLQREYITLVRISLTRLHCISTKAETKHEERRHRRRCSRRGLASDRQMVVPAVAPVEAQPYSTSTFIIVVGCWLRWQFDERPAVVTAGKKPTTLTTTRVGTDNEAVAVILRSPDGLSPWPGQRSSIDWISSQFADSRMAI
jgi:hypothetical protein